MSGYTDSYIAGHGVLEPGTHLVHKPFTEETLTRKVREILDAATTAINADTMGSSEARAPVGGEADLRG